MTRSFVALLFVLLTFSPWAQSQGALLQTTANPAIHQGYVDTHAGQAHYWEAGRFLPRCSEQ